MKKKSVPQNQHNFLSGFIKQFDPKSELNELSNDDWDVFRFLQWLELNNFKIVKKTVKVK